MSAYHYGDGAEVKVLADQLKGALQDIVELTQRGNQLLNKMQGSVKDSAYEEAENIVEEVQRSLLAGMEDAKEVYDQLHLYGEYLESLG